MLIVETLVFSPFRENTYLVWDDKTNIGAVIDPGTSTLIEDHALTEAIELNNVKLKYLFNTHLHIDHILGNHHILENYDVEFIYPRGDEHLIEIMKDEAVKYNILLNDFRKADSYFEDIDELKIGELTCKPIFTPGHTPGEYSLYFPEDKVCFTGDVLFEESIGRTDLWGGDLDVLINSIEDKLFTLPDETLIYSGHGNKTTIEHEKDFNPFI